MVIRGSVEGCGNCSHWFDEGFDPDEIETHSISSTEPSPSATAVSCSRNPSTEPTLDDQ